MDISTEGLRIQEQFFREYAFLEFFLQKRIQKDSENT